MKRYASGFLKNWFYKNSRKPLVIRGARQVGKTELVRIFCQENDLDLIEINFEERKIYEFQREDSFSVSRAVSEILAYKNKSISSKSILFIDEIQEIPKAYERLRFFKEQMPELPTIVAGSTLELAIKHNNLKSPVGRVEYLFLGPMSFSEFLMARSKTVFLDILENINFREMNSITSGMHNELVDLYKEYLYVGGMPEAVRVFCEEGMDFNLVRDVQNQIIYSYGEDIKKYTSGKMTKVITEVYEKFPTSVGEKIKYSQLSDERSTYVADAIELLVDVYFLQKVFHSNISGRPIKQGEKKKIFKIYHLDVGLYNAHLNTSWDSFNSSSYSTKSGSLITQGKIAEQFVAQHLLWGRCRSNHTVLNYWLRDQSVQKSEIDFVIEKQQIHPIEIKSGKTGKIKSLIEFMYEKKALSPYPVRFDLKYRENFFESCEYLNSTKKSVNFNLLNLPIFMVEFLGDE